MTLDDMIAQRGALPYRHHRLAAINWTRTQ
jgi:hypothetical protein